MICARCNQPFIHSKQGRPRYCVPCRPLVKKAASLAWAAAHPERTREIKTKYHRSIGYKPLSYLQCANKSCRKWFQQKRGNQVACSVICRTLRSHDQRQGQRNREAPRDRIACSFLREDLAQEQALARLEGRTFSRREFYRTHGYDTFKRKELPTWAA